MKHDTPTTRVRLDPPEQQATIAVPMLLKQAEAAKFLGIAPNRLAELNKDPKFPERIWIGRRGARYVASELLAWAMANRKRPARKPGARDV